MAVSLVSGLALYFHPALLIGPPVIHTHTHTRTHHYGSLTGRDSYDEGLGPPLQFSSNMKIPKDRAFRSMASEPWTSVDLFDPWEWPRGEDNGNAERSREEQRKRKVNMESLTKNVKQWN